MPSSKLLVPYSIKDAANLANKYARTFIIEGTTQLINNTYSIDKKESLAQAVKVIREKSAEESISWLEFDLYIHEYYQSIECSKKFSIGNCHEMAELALDYIAHHVPHVDAEIFELLGGNHVLLVVGRKKGSDARKPETWGDEAYICDPWSDDVYPASEYLSRTKNFYQEYSAVEGTYTNHIEDFNQSKHTFAPIRHYNTDYIRKYNSKEHIAKVYELFQKKQQMIISATVKLEAALINIRDKLEKKYGINNEKYDIITSKITKLQTLIGQLTKDFAEPINETNNYNEIVFQLDKILQDSIKAYSRAAEITSEEKTQLAKYVSKKENHFNRFFHRPPAVDVISKTSKALNESGEILKKVMVKATSPIWS